MKLSLCIVVLLLWSLSVSGRTVGRAIDSCTVELVDSLTTPVAGEVLDSLSCGSPMVTKSKLALAPDTVLYHSSVARAKEIERPDQFYRHDSLNRALHLRPTSRFGNWIDRATSSKAYQMTYIGVPLVAAAFIVKGQDAKFRSLRQSYTPAFHYPYDDYLQYGPAALMLGLKVAGVKGRSSWGRMLVSNAFSIALMSAAVNSVKYSAKVMRPDGSSRNSFPSGHTATAFMCATMLHKEYGWRSPWYSVAGYSMATATGVSRMLNNRHWLSDVLAGAGIGILATELGYYLADLIYKDRGINEASTLDTFDRKWRPSFVSFQIGFNIIPGTYHPLPDTNVSFLPGSSIGAEGAWFASPYVGVGGQVSFANNFLKLNNRSEENTLNSLSAYVGAYFSYPITTRWVAGGKVIAGYYHFDHCDTQTLSLGGFGRFSGGAGLSLLYRAKSTMNVRFYTDFKSAPPIIASSREVTWVVNLGGAIDVLF